MKKILECQDVECCSWKDRAAAVLRHINDRFDVAVDDLHRAVDEYHVSSNMKRDPAMGLRGYDDTKIDHLGEK